MGHRTYLIKASKAKSEELFEANNSIPFFWLTLIDINTVEKSEPEMIKLYHLNEEQSGEYLAQDISPAALKISKTGFLANAVDGAKFINKHFPQETGLYNDFVKYLDLTFDNSDTLELSLLEIANFNDVYLLLKSLKDEINAIKTDHINGIAYHIDGNIFSHLTGYDRFLSNKFKDHSTGYQTACENEDIARKKSFEAAKQTDKKEKRSKTYSGFMMLFIGLIFMCGIVFVMTKEGLVLETISGFFFSLAIIVAGYFKIKQ